MNHRTTTKTMKIFSFITSVSACLYAVAALSLNCKDYSKCRQMLDRMDIARLQMYDRMGDVRDDVFDTWQESNLKEWLDNHDVAAAANAKYEDLVATAKEHKDLLANDIKQYLQEAKKTAIPTMEKGQEYFKQTGDQLFDQAVDAWDDARLKAYLAARGVTSQVQRSTEDLRKLVKQKGNELAQKDIIGTWTFDTWSDEDLKKSLKKLGKQAKGSRDAMITALSQAAEDSQSFINEQKAGFESWPTNDLQRYLEKCGVPVHSIKHSKKDMIRLANQQHRLFTRGTTETTYDKIQRHACAIGTQTWIQAKRASIALYLKLKQLVLVVYHKLMAARAKKDL